MKYYYQRKKYMLLKAKNDALVAKVYGITKYEM